jgi:cytochrome c5
MSVSMLLTRVLTALPVVLAANLALGCQGQPPADSTVTMAAAETISAADQLILASAKVALPPAGILREDLPDPQSGGAQFLQEYCSTCHALPSPTMHSATDWPGVVRRMWLRLDLLDPQFAIPKPELGERIAMLDYLTQNALKVNHDNLLDAPGREFFEATCGQCHELPDPRQHSSQDWFVVVRRMNQHMRDILGRELSNPEIEQVTRYLTAAST